MNYENEFEDHLLLRASRDRDGVAFSHIIRRHQTRIIRFAARMLDGDVHAAADVAQETLIQLWESRDTYEARGEMASYLFRIAYNRCISRLRRPDLKSLPLSSAESMPASHTSIGLPMAVRNALHALPEAQRAVFLLHEYEGLSYNEIAEALSITIGTVGSRKNSAIKALRVSLASWLEKG